MNGKPARRKIGNRIAPPRFIAYFVMLAVASAVALAVPGNGGLWFMAGFDLATIAFLLSLIPLLGENEPASIAQHARDNDANRVGLLAIAGLLGITVLVVVASELGERPHAAITTPLVLVTLALAWLSGNIIYALHYAHLYYGEGDQPGGLARGLDFPGDDSPDYLDFANFALVIGMTFQTADIAITSRQVRRVSTGQCLAAFVFNLGIIAFTINILASH